MAADVTPFVFPTTGQTVRTVMVDGAPWFVAVDVCAVLEVGNARQAVSYLDDDEVSQSPVTTDDGSDRTLTTNIVSEAGLYSLVLRSRKPAAKAFKRWITHEVLPTLRRTGRYEVALTLGDPLDEIEAANQRTTQAVAIARAERARAELAETRVAELAPDAAAWDALAKATGDYSVREAAHILNRDPGISTGQNRLFDTLRDLRMVDGRNTPYAAHADHVRLRTYTYPDRVTGEDTAGHQVRVTVAGLRYLHTKLGGIRPIQLGGPEQLRLIEGGAA